YIIRDGRYLNVAQPVQRRLGDVLYRNAEVAIEFLVGGARAKTRHADEGAIQADDFVPALADRGLDRDLDRRRADHVTALGGGEGAEQLEARERNHARSDPALAQNPLCLDRD